MSPRQSALSVGQAPKAPPANVEWTKESVSRGTKCFSPMTNGYPGGYPVGYLKWLREMGWWSEGRRLHLPGGMTDDPGGFRVDIRPEVKPDLLADARNTGLPAESFDWVGVDPPYSEHLAETLYDTKAVYSGINAFMKEGARLLKPGGYLVSLSYEICKRPKDCDLVAMWGVYCAMSVRHMMALSVWRKRLPAAEPFVAEAGGKA